MKNVWNNLPRPRVLFQKDADTLSLENVRAADAVVLVTQTSVYLFGMYEFQDMELGTDDFTSDMLLEAMCQRTKAHTYVCSHSTLKKRIFELEQYNRMAGSNVLFSGFSSHLSLYTFLSYFTIHFV